MRRYAATTAVPIHRSRAEIDKLLRSWAADAVQWQDDFTNGTVTLRFAWMSLVGERPKSFLARLTIQLKPEVELRREAHGARGFSEARLEKLKAANGKTEHRLLLLWLKAAFNAIDAKIVTAEALFLPFFEGKNGQTFAEAALPRLPMLLTGNATRLLPPALEEEA